MISGTSGPTGDNIDLHTHSTASDGELSPAKLVRAAGAGGLSALALTDHDTVDGLAAARAEAVSVGIEFVDGVELSLTYRGAELHMLGYFIDSESQILLEWLNDMRRRRNERNTKILARFAGLDIHISEEDLIRAVGGEAGQSIGRPHLAKILVEKAVVRDRQEAFELYLGEGKPAFVPKEKLEAEAGIDIIHRTGGLAVLAHPLFCGARGDEDLTALVRRLARAGLDGIECYYSKHLPEHSVFYLRLAVENGLLVTGGSDFHGPTQTKDIRLGELAVPYRLLEKLKAAHPQRR